MKTAVFALRLRSGVLTERFFIDPQGPEAKAYERKMSKLDDEQHGTNPQGKKRPPVVRWVALPLIGDPAALQAWKEPEPAPAPAPPGVPLPVIRAEGTVSPPPRPSAPSGPPPIPETSSAESTLPEVNEALERAAREPPAEEG